MNYLAKLRAQEPSEPSTRQLLAELTKLTEGTSGSFVSESRMRSAVKTTLDLALDAIELTDVRPEQKRSRAYDLQRDPALAKFWLAVAGVTTLRRPLPDPPALPAERIVELLETDGGHLTACGSVAHISVATPADLRIVWETTIRMHGLAIAAFLIQRDQSR